MGVEFLVYFDFEILIKTFTCPVTHDPCSYNEQVDEGGVARRRIHTDKILLYLK